MQLYYIRHGQSGNNLLWEQTGSNAGRSFDPELSPLGQQQAALVAEFIKNSDQVPEKHPLDFQNEANFNLNSSVYQLDDQGCFYSPADCSLAGLTDDCLERSARNWGNLPGEQRDG